MRNISIYNAIGDIASGETIPIDIFLDNIRTGFWQDEYFRISRIEDHRERAEQKKKGIKNVTISGTFSTRFDDKLIEHSGIIAIDVDDKGFPDGVSFEGLRVLLSGDKYLYSMFRSISGRGYCLLFRINGDKHREAFSGLSEYLLKHYKIIVDPSGINPSRARFVSYDPDIYVAQHKVPRFTEYPKIKEPKKYPNIVFTSDDFGEILNQIVTNQLVIDQNNYIVWIKIAYALISKFGESGRQYFHTVSQYSTMYDYETCNKQFDACLKSHERDAERRKTANISTFYYYAKEAGCVVYSERTKTIAYATQQGKRSGLNAKDIISNLDRFEEIRGDDVAEIVQQVMASHIEIYDDTIIDQLEMYLRQNYKLRRNQITRFIDNDGVMLEQKDLNTIFLKLKKLFPKLPYELIDRLIHSDFIPTYNPFFEFFRIHGALTTEPPNISHVNELNAPKPPETGQNDGVVGHTIPHPDTATPNAIMAALGSVTVMYKPGTPQFATQYPTIAALWSCIKCDDAEHLAYFGTKWLCGIVSSMHGQHSPLYLALGGEKHGTGKTEFLRRLLPKELKRYFAQTKMDRDKDDEILMTQRLILLDDESSGKSKKEESKMKSLLSSDIITVREPYGRHNVDLIRLASLCSTTNIPESILNDLTGNRRFITVNVLDIDNKRYNQLDKVELWCEVYRLYKSGFEWEVPMDEQPILNKHAEAFQTNSPEADLIMQYFAPDNTTDECTPTQIKAYLEKNTQQRLSSTRLGLELKRLGFEQRHVKYYGTTKRVWLVRYTDGFSRGTPTSPRAIDTWEPPKIEPGDRPF